MIELLTFCCHMWGDGTEAETRTQCQKCNLHLNCSFFRGPQGVTNVLDHVQRRFEWMCNNHRPKFVVYNAFIGNQECNEIHYLFVGGDGKPGEDDDVDDDDDDNDMLAIMYTYFCNC